MAQKKGPKNPDRRLFLTFLSFLLHFLLILNQKKNTKFQKYFFENLKDWAQKC